MAFDSKLNIYEGSIIQAYRSDDIPTLGSISYSSDSGYITGSTPSFFLDIRESSPTQSSIYYWLKGERFKGSSFPLGSYLPVFVVPIVSNEGTVLAYAGAWIQRNASSTLLTSGISTTPTGPTNYGVGLHTSYITMADTDDIYITGCYNGSALYATVSRYSYSGYYSSDVMSAYGTPPLLGVGVSQVEAITGGTIQASLVSDEYGIASSEGGYTGGTFDDSSDTISIPAMPALGVTSAGFVNVYNPSAGTLQGLGSELFPDLNFTPDATIGDTGGVTEALEAMANALVNFGNQIPNVVNTYINSNLINYVIDCHIIPVAPAVGGASNIKIGFKTFSPSAPTVTSDYVDFNCGDLNVGEYYANFIDYAPYTRAKLFLPFVGFVDLSPEFFQSGKVNVTYRFNIIDGSFMAYVSATSSKSNLKDSVVMQFGGNACVHIPLTGLNYSSMVSGVVSGVAAVASAQSGVQAVSTAASSAVEVANSKPPVQQSNGYNATTAFIGIRTPYLLIERSVSNFSASYTDEQGLPSNISSSFNKLSGFTQASSVHLDGITGATSDEIAEIGRLLAEGVIL